MTFRTGLLVSGLVIIVVIVIMLGVVLLTWTTQTTLPTLLPTLPPPPVEPSPQNEYLTATSVAQATVAAQKTQVVATELAGFGDKLKTIAAGNQEVSVAQTKRADAYTQTAEARRSPTPNN